MADTVNLRFDILYFDNQTVAHFTIYSHPPYLSVLRQSAISLDHPHAASLISDRDKLLVRHIPIRRSIGI